MYGGGGSFEGLLAPTFAFLFVVLLLRNLEHAWIF